MNDRRSRRSLRSRSRSSRAGAALVATLVAGLFPGCDRGDSTPTAPAAPETSTAAPPAAPADAPALVSTTTAVPAAPPPTATPAASTPPAALVTPVNPAPGTPPAIAFDTRIHDFGVMPETEVRTASFGFTNTGGDTLVIQDVKTSCGCTAATPDKRSYEPGERGALSVTFDPSGPGEQKKFINMFTNAPSGMERLQIQADVQAFVSLEPRILRLDVLPLGREHIETVTVDCPDPEFSLDKVQVTNPHVAATVRPERGPNGRRTIDLLIAPTAPWGGFFSWLEVTVTGQPSPGAAPITHSSKLRIQAQVFGEISADQDTFRFGVKPNEAFERTIRLMRSSGAPFEVLSAELSASTLPGAEIELVPVGPNAYDLILTARGAAVPTSHRGTVLVTTDVRGETRIELPIVGGTRTSPAGVQQRAAPAVTQLAQLARRRRRGRRGISGAATLHGKPYNRGVQPLAAAFARRDDADA